MLNKAIQPNIIVLVLDAVRASALSAYQPNAQQGTTNLDRFAEDSVLFRRAFTTSTWTIPTHASMLSGLYLSQHRVENINANRSFNKAIVPLPVALRSQGYWTAAFSQNILFSPKYFLDTMFDDFFTSDQTGDDSGFAAPMKTQPNGLSRSLLKVSRYMKKAGRTRPFLSQIHNWVSQRKGPFMVFANLTQAHYPWAPSPGFLLRKIGLRRLRSVYQNEYFTMKPFDHNSGKVKVTPAQREMWKFLYGAAIMQLDRDLGYFFNQLKRWKGWNNTIVVVTADHGEMLGDYRDIVGHTLSLHDNILHVPLLVRHPDYPKGLIVDGVVQNHDLFTSLLEWTGSGRGNIPEAQLQRPSLSRAMDNPASLNGYAFAEEDFSDSYDVIQGLKNNNPAYSLGRFPRQQIAVRSAYGKYVWRDDGRDEFFNLFLDPLESNNLFLERDPVSRRLIQDHQAALENWRSSLVRFPPYIWSGKATAMTPEVEARLKELGYLD